MKPKSQPNVTMSTTTIPEQFLDNILYRHTCPDADILLNYAWNFLDMEQKESVATHLHYCPHCKKETAQLQPSPHPASKPTAVRTRSYLARLLPSFALVRGETRGINSMTHVYEVEEIGWDVTLSWSAAAGGTFIIQGQLFGPDANEMKIVTTTLTPMLPTTAVIQPQTPDKDGIFTFTTVPPNQYQIQLQASVGQIIIADIEVM